MFEVNNILFIFLILGFKAYNKRLFPFGTNKYFPFGEKLFSDIIDEFIIWDMFIYYLF
jgi:hypothetical protein